MSEGLRQLGYDLQPSEVAILMQQLDLNSDGQVSMGFGGGWKGGCVSGICQGQLDFK
jgi:hypothetical protein